MASDRKLGFRVVFAASEDVDYPAAELNYHSPQTKGWQSARFCEFPQEIGLAFADGVVNISQIQLLSHQSKIATRIELFVGTGDGYFDATFTRLGYLSLDSNERTQYKARELKSVYIRARGAFLKLVIHKCYANPQNLFNQVGLIAVNVLGQPASADGSDALAAPMPLAGPAAKRAGAPGPHDLATSLALDPETASLLREVAQRKEAAVVAEDFAAAKRLKVLQDAIKAVGGALAQLVADKAAAVAAEDYDRAAELKGEIARIRASLNEKLVEAGLRGPPPSSGPAMHKFTGGYGGDGGRGHVPGPAYFGAPHPSDGGFFAGSGPGSAGSGGGGGSGGFSGGAGSGSGAPGSPYAPSAVDERPIRPARRGAGGAAPAAGDDDGGGAEGGAGGDDGYGSDGGAPGSARGPPLSPHEGGDDDGHGSSSGGYSARPASRMLRPAPTNALETALARDQPVPASAGVAGVGRRAAGAAAAAPPPPAAEEAGADGGEDDGSGLGGGGVTGPRADPAQLVGVDNAGDLPAPEALSPAAAKEAGPLIDLFGAYVAQCYYSRAWALREAALRKMAHDLPRIAAGGAPPGAIMAACIGVCTAVTARDKIAHVFVAAATQLLPALLTAAPPRRGGDGAPGLESLAAGLVDKLGDNTPRVRDAAMAALLSIARCEGVGAGFVTAHVVRKMSRKQASSTRSLQSRLQLLARLIDEAGALSPAGGLSPDMLVHYCGDLGCFQHASGDIRGATQELFVAVFRVIGPSLMPQLAPHLRPKQIDEYTAAFNTAKPGSMPVGYSAGPPAPGANTGGVGHSGPAGGGAAHSPGGAGAGAGRKAGGGGGGAGRKAGGGAAASPAPAAAGGAGHGDDDGEGGDGTCQFCGGCGPGASEAQLDLHYFRDCPLLTTCAACTQVVEIATLSEHLLTECEKKGEYAPCPNCSAAIRAKELDAHLAARTCRPAPDPAVGARCPLCAADIAADKDGWSRHLLTEGCARNPRTNRPAASKGGIGVRK